VTSSLRRLESTLDSWLLQPCRFYAFPRSILYERRTMFFLVVHSVALRKFLHMYSVLFMVYSCLISSTFTAGAYYHRRALNKSSLLSSIFE
jgi:hypothetical protein